MQTIQEKSKALSDILKFALAHDWCASAVISDCAVYICDTSGDTVKFTDLRTLKAWAGY
jgi:hypothetical protein